MKRGLFLMIAGLLLAGCGQADPRADAYSACEQAVEDHFDATGMKGFAGYDAAQVRNTDGVYEVQAYVASTNGLGQPSRVDFTCQLRHDGGSWDLVDLDLS